MRRAHRRRRRPPLPRRGTARSRRRGQRRRTTTRRGAALDHQPRDALFGQRMQHGREIEPGEAWRWPRGSLARRPHRASWRRPLPRVSDAITHSGVSRAERTSRLVPGMRRLRSSTTRTGERASMPGRRQSAADRPPAPCRCRPGWRRFARARDAPAPRAASPVIATRLATGSADLAVGRDRELQDHMRAVIPDAAEMPGVVEGGFARAQTHIHHDAGRAQPRMALTGDFRIGILDRGHHPLDAGGDHCVGARWRLAEMRARLQRDVERGAARGSPARRSASGSPCGRPPGWVQPRPTITPSLTMTAPTAGLGQVGPCRACRAPAQAP